MGQTCSYWLSCSGLVGNPFFLKMGARPLKMGAMAPLLRKKGVLAKKIILKYTDRVYLWYQFGNYQEIPTKYLPKIPNRYTTLDIIGTKNWPTMVASGFCPCIAYGPVAPKPSAPAPSSHHRQCGLCLVWASYVCVSKYII